MMVTKECMGCGEMFDAPGNTISANPAWMSGDGRTV